VCVCEREAVCVCVCACVFIASSIASSSRAEEETVQHDVESLLAVYVELVTSEVFCPMNVYRIIYVLMKPMYVCVYNCNANNRIS